MLSGRSFARLCAATALLVALAGLYRWHAASPAVSVHAQAPDPELSDVVLFKNPKPAPSLHLTALDGKTGIDLTALRGRVVLLNFWATWCGPCREEIPEFERLQTQYAGKIQVIGLSVDEIAPAAVAQAAAKLGINYPVGMASDELQTRFGGMSSIPVTFVIDRNGQVMQKNRGANPYSVFDNEIRALLGMPLNVKVVRIDQLSPNGKVGTIEIPGIAAELKELTPAQRQKALAELNSQSCTCGCDWSLATCRVQDPGCSLSLPAARKLIAALKAGKASPLP